MDPSPLEAPGQAARHAVLAALRERLAAFAASRFGGLSGGEGAEDLVQETLMLIHTKYGHLERPEDLVPLAFQILRFKAAAARRKALRRGEAGAVDAGLVEDPDPDPEAQAERRQRVERLRAALGRLGDRCRTLFRLKLEGKGFAEIQAILGAESLNTVYTWDHRCRKRLLEAMGGRW